MPRQADPATPEELAGRIAKLPAWARKHIETREELIRVLGQQVASLQAAPVDAKEGYVPSELYAEAREQIAAWEAAYEALKRGAAAQDTDDVLALKAGTIIFPGVHVTYGPHDAAAGAEVLAVSEFSGGPLIVRPVTASEIIIARGLANHDRTEMAADQ